MPKQDGHRWFAAVWDFQTRHEPKKLHGWRRETAGGANGNVLEIGCGAGANFELYGDGVTGVVAIEPDPFMLKRASARAAELGGRIQVREESAEQLPFGDASFDTVVSTWNMCSVPDFRRALTEVRRVLKPEGEYRFMDHVRYNSGTARVPPGLRRSSLEVVRRRLPPQPGHRSCHPRGRTQHHADEPRQVCPARATGDNRPPLHQGRRHPAVRVTAQPDTGHVTLPESRLPVIARPDVLVVGGGSAGVAAAVAAARNGAETLLVERFSYTGGLATGGMIILLLTMDDGRGNQVIGGVCQEMVDRMAARGAAYFPPKDQWNDPDPRLVEHARRWGLVWGSGPHRVRYSVAFEPQAFIFAADEMLSEAGVRVLYQTWACEPVLEDGRITAVVVQNKTGRQAIAPKIVIDATGDGDVFAAAGEPFESERVHPWLWFEMGGVTEVEAALESGKGLFFRTTGSGRVLVPWGGEGRVRRKIDATDPGEVSESLVECRRMVAEEASRLRASVPGFEDAHISLIADQLGITESRRLLGRQVLTRDDLDREFGDSIGRTGHWTKYDCVYNIPYSCLLPRGVDNLLVAGRCISVDHRTHHATKEIPACMATGQAAGTAAAIAASAGIGVGEVDMGALRKRLMGQGAILT